MSAVQHRDPPTGKRVTPAALTRPIKTAIVAYLTEGDNETVFRATAADGGPAVARLARSLTIGIAPAGRPRYVLYLDGYKPLVLLPEHDTVVGERYTLHRVRTSDPFHDECAVTATPLAPTAPSGARGDAWVWLTFATVLQAGALLWLVGYLGTAEVDWRAFALLGCLVIGSVVQGSALRDLRRDPTVKATIRRA